MPTPYAVQSGDCLWTISQAAGETLSQIENDNPQVLQKSGSWDLIWPQETVYLDGEAPTATLPAVTPSSPSSVPGVPTITADQTPDANGYYMQNLITAGQYLMARGYTRIAAAGIAADIAGESSGNPESGSEGAGGLIGWTGSWNPSWGTMLTGNATADFQTQLAAIVAYNNEFGNGLVNQLNSQPDVQSAADFYSQNFEKPAVTDSDVRLDAGLQVYNALGSTQGAGPTTTITVTPPPPPAPPPPAPSQNPFRGISNLSVERIDEGQDYGGNGPVYGINSGVITSIWGAGWPGGVYIIEKLDTPVNGNQYVYFAEDITPNVTIGEAVDSNTVIGTLNGQMEVGWSTAVPQQTLAASLGEYTSDGVVTSAGVSFAQFLQTIGAPSGA